MSTLLAVQGMTKRYGARTVLDGVSFTAREGEILGLIGPNGAGKTTLFECLAGLMPVEDGTVEFRGATLPPARRKDALFYMPDGIRPWSEQSVEWALGFFESLWGGARGDLVEALQLSPLRRSRIASLSKGEAKRLLLALALLTPHPLLLLDEPFDGLDFRQTRDVMAILRGVPAAGRTLFLSIHQLTDASRVCDRLVLLSRGRIVGEGTLSELQSRARLAEGGLEEIFLALT
jgi:ABC-2 type transport system ATP-binding protein